MGCDQGKMRGKRCETDKKKCATKTRAHFAIDILC